MLQCVVKVPWGGWQTSPEMTQGRVAALPAGVVVTLR